MNALENPGYVDLQVNGYWGVDFNSDGLTAEGLHLACERLRADGLAGILATLITDDLARMAARLARIASLREHDPLVREVILGFHIEGPFISPVPGCAGAHPVEHVRPADLDVMLRLLDAAEGLVRLVTLAPECDEGLRVTRFLADQGILVSAGHCDPSLDQLRAAMDTGLTMFTHLGNGCPATVARHDNIIQRALSLCDRLVIMFIADGVHVPHFALKNYLRVTGLERAIAVTDCISAAGLGPGRYAVGSQEVRVGEDGIAWSADGTHFVGSTTTMPEMAVKMRPGLGLNEREIQRLVCRNPCRVLGIE